MAVPLISASFIQMAYSMTDMLWLGHLGSDAVAAAGAAGFFTWLCNALSFMTKIGAEITVSQSVGSKDYRRAAHYASHDVCRKSVHNRCIIVFELDCDARLQKLCHESSLLCFKHGSLTFCGRAFQIFVYGRIFFVFSVVVSAHERIVRKLHNNPYLVLRRKYGRLVSRQLGNVGHGKHCVRVESRFKRTGVVFARNVGYGDAVVETGAASRRPCVFRCVVSCVESGHVRRNGGGAHHQHDQQQSQHFFVFHCGTS